MDWNTAYGTLSDITAFNHWQFVPNNNGGQPFITYDAYGTTNNLTNESEELRWTSPRGKTVQTRNVYSRIAWAGRAKAKKSQ